MTTADVSSWRKAEGGRLIAAREGLDATRRQLFGQRIDAYVWRSFPGLAAGEPSAGEPSALASPVCYATEVDPGHFGERRE